MERYEEYKDSGVEWIGEIPAGWGLKKLKYIAAMSRGFGIPKTKVTASGEPCVRYGELYTRYNGVIRDVVSRVTKQTFDASERIEPEELVMALTGETKEDIGRTSANLSGGAVAVGGDTLLIRNHQEVGRFLSYALGSNYSEVQRYLDAQGEIIVHLSADKIRSEVLILPDPTTQVAIADFLDAKTEGIDDMVANCEREVELLQEYRKAVVSEAVTKGLDPNAPMKDSGIDWIGEIPEGWEVGKVKYAYINRDSERVPVEASKRNQSAEVLYPYYGASGVVDFISDFIFDEPLLLIGEDGANLRLRNLPLIYAANGRYWVNNHAHILQPAEMMDYRYSFYQLELVDLENYLTGSTQPKLTAENLGLIPVAMPSMREQQEIAAYLDVKTAEIDSFIADYRSITDKLREYRKSLISEAVTGKFKVPGVA